MPKFLSDLWARLKQTWTRLSPPQKLLVALMGGAVVVSLLVAWYLNRPVFTILQSGLDPKDTATINAALTKASIPTQISPDGTAISVPEAQKPQAKLVVATTPGLSTGNVGPGFELFDNPKLTATDFDKQVNLVRARQGELQRALMTMDDIESVSPMLLPSDPSPFARDQRPPTASVIVKTKSGRSLTQATANAIIAATASTVDGLTFANVRLADTTGRSYYYNGDDATMDSDKLTIQRAQEKKYQQDIMDQLERIVGPGHVVVAVSLDLNWQTKKVEQTDLGPNQPTSTQTSREATSSTNTSTNPVGTQPTDPNATPNYPVTTTGNGASQTDKYTTETNYQPSSKTVTSTTQPPGTTFTSKTASVTIDADSPNAPANDAAILQIKNLVANTLGGGATTNDVSVVVMPFAATPAMGVPIAQGKPIQPLTLSIALGVIMLLLFLIAIGQMRRRPAPEPALQPLLSSLPSMAPQVGTTLDVALGLERGAGQEMPAGLADLSGGLPGIPAGPGSGIGMPPVPGLPGLPGLDDSGPEDKTDLLDTKNARQQLEMVIQAKPKRQLVIGNQEIPPEFLTILEDLATNASEACAEVLRNWLKGTTNPNSKLTGPQKAAIFSINIGPDLSARMIQHLSDEEIEALTVQIARAEKVTATERDDLFQEFIEITTAERYIHSGGIDYARQLLSKALGERRANDILQRLTSHLRKRPFDSVRRTDPSQLASFLQNEHPQTVAVVLAHLPADQASLVIADLPQERQADIVKRIATLDPTSPEMLREAERVLERKLSALMAQESSAAGGISWVVDVLNRVDRTTERSIMGQLSAEDPELANDIAQRMFLFEDVVRLDDITVQRVLRDVDMNKDLPLALKAAKEEVWRKITANVSRRTAEALKEAVDLLGPVRIRDVEEAQARIVSLIRKLDEMGEIQLTRGGEQDEFV